MNGKGKELELVVHTVGGEGLGTLNPNLFFPIRSHRAFKIKRNLFWHPHEIYST